MSVRIIRKATEAEVIAAFLSGELDSPRWRASLLALVREDQMDPRVISEPDVNDAAESAYREQLLERHRAWLRREGLFEGFPLSVEWSLAALTPVEVLAIRYINWDWWLRVSGGTRRPADAAVRIRRNEIEGVTAEEHEAIAARVRSASPPPPLVVVAQPGGEALVVLEGHVRLTAYALYPDYLPDELEIFLGTAADMERWTEF